MQYTTNDIVKVKGMYVQGEIWRSAYNCSLATCAHKLQTQGEKKQFINVFFFSLPKIWILNIDRVVVLLEYDVVCFMGRFYNTIDGVLYIYGIQLDTLPYI